MVEGFADDPSHQDNEQHKGFLFSKRHLAQLSVFLLKILFAAGQDEFAALIHFRKNPYERQCHQNGREIVEHLIGEGNRKARIHGLHL